MARLTKAATRSPVFPAGDTSCLPSVDVDAVVRTIHQDSYAILNLPQDAVSQIVEFSNTHPCKAKLNGRDVEFLAKDRRSVEADAGTSIPMAAYDVKDCPLLNSLEGDPVLLRIATEYLGFPIKSIQTRLFWSFVVDLQEHERLSRGQTVRFHYDLHGFNFLYFHFYMTDTDARGGAHVLVKGTHHRKPLKFLFSSANQTDEDIVKTYGADAIVTLTGTAGFGFVEDTFCYHKALPPISSDRLMLQLRVS